MTTAPSPLPADSMCLEKLARVGTDEILRRWARWLAEYGGTLELPAEPPASSIWRTRNAPAGLVASLVTAAGLAREVGGRVAWGITVAATRPTVLDALAHSGPVQDDTHEWRRIREVGDDGALLVRPDQIIAWRALQAHAKPQAELEAALRAVLRKSKAVA